jgi:hypothetical protein
MVEANAVVYEGEQRVVRVGRTARPYNRATSNGNTYSCRMRSERTWTRRTFGNLNVRDFPAMRRLFQVPKGKIIFLDGGLARR